MKEQMIIGLIFVLSITVLSFDATAQLIEKTGPVAEKEATINIKSNCINIDVFNLGSDKIASNNISGNEQHRELPYYRIYQGNLKDFGKIVNHDFNKFEFNQFKNPDSFYWPGYFWDWDEPLTGYLIMKPLTDMALHKALNVVPVPMPKEFRLGLSPTALDPHYMTTAFLDLYNYAAEQWQSLHMNMCLYDEGEWPSGTCDGRVFKQNSSLVQKRLTQQLLTPENGSIISIPNDCLSAFLYKGDTRIKQLNPGTTDTINIDNARIMLFTVRSDGLLPNGVTEVSTEFSNYQFFCSKNAISC